MAKFKISLSIWILLFTAGTVYTVHDVRKLGTQNKERIIDIQKSRIHSCRETYMALRELLLAAYGGQKLTAPEQKQFNKLLSIANPKRCVQQTKPVP